MAYRELAPPHDLARVVRCLWVRWGSDEDAVVLPDGCLDVIARNGRAQVAGADTGPVAVTLGREEVVVGVRLRPGAAGAALGVDAEELRDRRVDLEDVWGRAGREAGERAGDDPLALLAALRDRLRRAAPDPRVIAAARRLDVAPGTSVPALADAVGLGERHLRRRFSAAVGYGPKTFARVARFRRALVRLHAGDPPAAVAAAAGYADQAHMTRDMGALAGSTPAELAAQGRVTLPSSPIVQRGLWATSQGWPSGSQNAPE